MDTEDSEMMDTETASSGANHNNDAGKDLLTLARQFINQGKPSQALQAVLPLYFQFTHSSFFYLSSFPFSF